MKGLAGMGLLGFLALTAWWMTASVGDSNKYMAIQLAYGNLGKKGIEMHTNVGITMVAVDPLKVEKDKKKNMDDWVQEHFTLTDSSGQSLPFERRNNSNVIKAHQALGTQEFFIVACVKPGTQYQFDYKPVAKGTQTYRYKFIAPAQPEKPATINFDLVR
jgi:hypothetical protein